MRTLHEWMQYMEEKRQQAAASSESREALPETDGGPRSELDEPSGNANPPARDAASDVLASVPPRLEALHENARRALQARQARQRQLPLNVEPPPPRARRRTTAESREELIQRLLDPQLNLQETAKLLDVCPATVRRYTNRGILRHTRTPGNQRRFRLSDVLEFMERQQRDL